MTRVICDNNIWHRISLGEFQNELNTVSLIGTYVNAEELATSWDIIHDFKYIQGVFQAFNKYHKKIIEINPLDFILFHTIPEYKPNTEKFKQWLGIIERILQTPSNFKLGWLGRYRVKRFIKKHEKKYGFLTKDINKKLKMMKKPFLSWDKNKRAVYLQQNTLEINKEWVASMLSGYSGMAITKEMIDWKYFELFIHAVDRFFRNLEKNLRNKEHMKVKQNDWCDLFNLVYVTPGNLYFTRDNEWIKRAIKESGMEHYLHPSCST